MKFPVAVVLAFLASAYAQTSSTANSFTIPSSGFAPRAGSSIQVTWNPTTSGTVSLYLRSGASNNLGSGTPIAQNIANSGSFTWNVASDITRGSDYTLEIRSQDGLSNYSPYFVIESTNTVASNTNSASSSASARTSGATVSSSGSVTVTSSVSSAATTGSSSAATTASTSGSSSSSGTRTTTSGASSTSNSAGFQSTSATSSKTNAAPQATAAAGLMAAVAMAAFAL